MWQSSGDSVMYVREKASLFRHAFSFSVHIPRSLWSNDTQMSPQQTNEARAKPSLLVLCLARRMKTIVNRCCFVSQDASRQYRWQHHFLPNHTTKRIFCIRYAIFSCSDVAKIPSASKNTVIQIVTFATTDTNRTFPLQKAIIGRGHLCTPFAERCRYECRVSNRMW